MKNLFLLLLIVNVIYAQGPQNTDNHIKIDQFGYRPADKKIAVISNPQVGYNSNQPFTPGNTYEIRDWSTNQVVYSGSLTSWNSGATHSQSGDKVWYFDFTSVTAPGSYYVFDPTNNKGSYRFEIDECIYAEVLKHACRSFYYQRCGMAKQLPYAGQGWVDNQACHVGALQDKDCRLYNDNNPSTSKDLSGGWHDAGDYNKYVNFVWSTVIDLLLAYEENTAAWGDNCDLPESGNTIPDILDEVKYELDWLLKMQQSNGSVLCITGAISGGGGSPPSADKKETRYGPATTAASYTAATLFALGSIEFKKVGQNTYASTLQTAAINAWTWAQANPNVTFKNSGIIGGGEQNADAYELLSRQVSAACFLYALTGNTTYRTFFDNNYNQIHLMQWTFAYAFEQAQQSVLLYYTEIPGATTTVVNDIKTKYKTSLSSTSENLPSFLNATDAYRAYIKDQDYGWGSNSSKSSKGNMYMAMNQYSIDGANALSYKEAAQGFLNYIHGVNPIALVYLSAMGSFGAENFVTEFYHNWFTNGSALWDKTGVSTYGPAPGFLPGGPNPGWSLDACCPSNCGSTQNNALCVLLEPPDNQPAQKSYRDWNTSWPQNSWSVTENGIYYQAAYIRLLSKFVSTGCIETKISKENTQSCSIRLFPNPAQDKFYVLFNQPLSDKKINIELMDLQGRTIMHKTSATGKKMDETDISALNPGIYMVIIKNNNFRFVERLVVVK